MTITKRGIDFELTLKGNNVKLRAKNIPGYASFYISSMKEKTVFSYSSMNYNGVKMLGFGFTKEQIKSLNDEYNRQKEEIKEFLNKGDYKIQCLSYSHYYVIGEEAKRLKEMNERLFNDLFEELLSQNKKNLKEVDRVKEPYENDVIYYVLEQETETIVSEYIRDLTEEEAKEYDKGDKIIIENKEYFVDTRGRETKDIDYGNMIKSFKVLVEKKREMRRLKKI